MKSDYPLLRPLEKLCRDATGDNMAHYTDDLRADTIGTIERYFIAPLKIHTLSADRKADLDDFMTEYKKRHGQSIASFSDAEIKKLIAEMEELLNYSTH